MSSDFPLDWTTLAVSIFNTILLLWLGSDRNFKFGTPLHWCVGCWSGLAAQQPFLPQSYRHPGDGSASAGCQDGFMVAHRLDSGGQHAVRLVPGDVVVFQLLG